VDKWRREPWEANPYDFIPNFEVARDLPAPDAAVVLDKLKTSLEEGWTDDYLATAAAAAGGSGGSDATPCMVCGKTDGEESFVLCDGCEAGASICPLLSST